MDHSVTEWNRTTSIGLGIQRLSISGDMVHRPGVAPGIAELEVQYLRLAGDARSC